jgi:hypothetical protein
LGALKKYLSERLRESEVESVTFISQLRIIATFVCLTFRADKSGHSGKSCQGALKSSLVGLYWIRED